MFYLRRRTLGSPSCWQTTSWPNPNDTMLADAGIIDDTTLTPVKDRAPRVAPGDFGINIWNRTSGRCLHTLYGHTSVIGSIAFSPCGKLLLTASYDGTAKLWNADSGEVFMTFANTDRCPMHHAAFSPNGMLVLLSFCKALEQAQCATRIMSATSGECLRVLKGHTAPVNTALFSARRHGSNLAP